MQIGGFGAPNSASFFFPLHEDFNKKSKKYETIHSVFNDKATHAYTWRMSTKHDLAGIVGGKKHIVPAGWIRAVLYKDSGCNNNGDLTELDRFADSYIDTAHGWSKWKVKLKGRPWKGQVIGNGLFAPDVAGEVSSVRIELKGHAVP
jgi:hypothetical protein